MNFNTTYKIDTEGEFAMLVATSCHHVPFEVCVPVVPRDDPDWMSADDWTRVILRAVEEAEDLLEWEINERAREQAK